MTIKSIEKKQALIAELGETDIDGLTKTLEVLDNYTVAPPSAEATDHLLAIVTLGLPEQPVHEDFAAEKDIHFFILARLQLALSQARLFSCSFIAFSILLLLCGIGLTSMLNGDTVRFLANAAPLLGILTLLYQFRSNYNRMNELEATCPYTPAQLAAARLLLVLVYDTLLCLAATFLVSNNHYELWQVIVHWLAPLFLTLGIALLSSLHFGIWGGCLLSTAVWVINLVASKDGKSIFSVLVPYTPIIYLDLIGTAIGLTLLAFAYRRLSRADTEL
jgi:hypothetical protein